MARGTTVTLRKSTARLNPQDLSAITCWVGCTSKGTVNVMQTLTQTSSMRSTVGYGPAASGAAECLNIGGAPVYFIASNGFSNAFAVAALGDFAVLVVIAVNYKSLDVVESASSIAAVTGVAVDLPSDSDTEGRLAEAAEKAASRRRKLTALWIFLVLATVSFWPAYHQNGSGLNLWAVGHTDRVVWGHEIQPPMFSLVNSLVCIFCGGLIVRAVGWLWDRTGRRGDGQRDGDNNPATPSQTPPLSFSTMLGYLTMAASFACLLVAPIAKSHPAWLVTAIVLSSIAEILISSLGLAQVAKLTPRHLQPIYTSIWFVTSGIGGQLAGWLGSWELLTGFRVLVALCLTGALVAGSLRRKLDV